MYLQKNVMKNSYLAHVRLKDNKVQTLAIHLQEVALIAKQLAAKINVPEAGELIGLLHDFGKYSKSFQDYIQSATGLIDPDSDNFVNAGALKGKIDHSTAGAQWVWQELSKDGKNSGRNLCGQILALCIASHHSGLIDCLTPHGINGFKKRMDKEDEKSNLAECKKNAGEVDADILEQARNLADKPLMSGMLKQIKLLMRQEQHGQTISDKVKHFYIGFWTRFLFSCLIDADRINSADFEIPKNASYRNNTVSWDIAIKRLELFLTEQKANKTTINII